MYKDTLSKNDDSSAARPTQSSDSSEMELGRTLRHEPSQDATGMAAQSQDGGLHAMVSSLSETVAVLQANVSHLTGLLNTDRSRIAPTAAAGSAEQAVAPASVVLDNFAVRVPEL